MTTPMRMLDAADLLKALLQDTQDSTPDNPAEQLTDYVPAPETSSDAATVMDTVALPNTPHAATYSYGNAASLYQKAQWT